MIDRAGETRNYFVTLDLPVQLTRKPNKPKEAGRKIPHLPETTQLLELDLSSSLSRNMKRARSVSGVAWTFESRCMTCQRSAAL
jgi:hypothetical protein